MVLTPSDSMGSTQTVSTVQLVVKQAGFLDKVNVEQIEAHADRLLADFNESIIDNSPISMLPSFHINPTGAEHGNFLVIDLGGSTLRIAVVEIRPPPLPNGPPSASDDTDSMPEETPDDSIETPATSDGHNSIDRPQSTAIDGPEVQVPDRAYTDGLKRTSGGPESTPEGLESTPEGPESTPGSTEGSQGAALDRINIVIERKWIMENTQKTIDRQFFRRIGQHIVDIIADQTVISPHDVVNMGITWSFPLDQKTHDSGNIVYVGKGWTIAPEIYNQNLKTILEDTLLFSFGIRSSVKVIVNDSLAVFAAGKFLSSDLQLAMVLGTGFNMCCALQTDQLHPQKKLGAASVLINSEMSLFGTSLFPLATEIDGLLDPRFRLPPLKYHMKVTETIFQPLEMMTSGRYLPELTRLLLLQLYESRDLFKGISIDSSNELFVPYDGLNNELLCKIQESLDYGRILRAFSEEVGIEASLEDARKIKEVVDAVVERASYIVVISLVAFIKLLVQHNKETFPSGKLIVGYVGSILEYFVKYRRTVLRFINECEYVKQLGIEVELMQIDDSSIVGAAIGAAYWSGEPASLPSQ